MPGINNPEYEPGYLVNISGHLKDPFTSKVKNYDEFRNEIVEYIDNIIKLHSKYKENDLISRSIQIILNIHYTVLNEMFESIRSQCLRLVINLQESFNDFLNTHLEWMVPFAMFKDEMKGLESMIVCLRDTHGDMYEKNKMALTEMLKCLQSSAPSGNFSIFNSDTAEALQGNFGLFNSYGTVPYPGNFGLMNYDTAAASQEIFEIINSYTAAAHQENNPGLDNYDEILNSYRMLNSFAATLISYAADTQENHTETTMKSNNDAETTQENHTQTYLTTMKSNNVAITTQENYTQTYITTMDHNFAKTTQENYTQTYFTTMNSLEAVPRENSDRNTLDKEEKYDESKQKETKKIKINTFFKSLKKKFTKIFK